MRARARAFSFSGTLALLRIPSSTGTVRNKRAALGDQHGHGDVLCRPLNNPLSYSVPPSLLSLPLPPSTSLPLSFSLLQSHLPLSSVSPALTSRSPLPPISSSSLPLLLPSHLSPPPLTSPSSPHPSSSLRGEAEEPLAEDHLRFKCTARSKEVFSIDLHHPKRSTLTNKVPTRPHPSPLNCLYPPVTA